MKMFAEVFVVISIDCFVSSTILSDEKDNFESGYITIGVVGLYMLFSLTRLLLASRIPAI